MEIVQNTREEGKLMGIKRRMKAVFWTVMLFVVVLLLYITKQIGNFTYKGTVQTDGPRYQQMASLDKTIVSDEKRLGFHGIDALSIYSDQPRMETNGNEGRFMDGFILKLVHVFIRHGERTAIRSFDEKNWKNYNCKFSTWYNGSNEKFRAFPQRMDQMSRKMKVFPIQSSYPNQSKCLNYVLTSRGALQLMQLGQHFYHLYTKHPDLFDKNRPLSNQIKYTTTRYSRTYQSAIAFLYGFLPVFDIRRFDIKFSANTHLCRKNFPMNLACNCSHSDRLYNCSMRFLRAISKTNPNSGMLLDKISNILSVNKNNLWDTDRTFLQRDVADFINLRYSSVKMTPVLIEVVKNMKDRLENKLGARLILYSGHDVTLIPLLTVFGIYDGRRTPFASRVVIELYEKKNVQNTSRFYLKFLYNGVDKSKDVLFCKNRTVNGYCKFALFDDFVTFEILTRFGYANYSDACLRKQDTFMCKIYDA